ncbi:MAG: iron-containing alcohol dehydrogenase, partial [Candidatus Promineifilaceae bacterium]
MVESHSTYLWPGQTHFGFGTAALAGEVVRSLGAGPVFVLTDPGVAAAGLLNPVIDSLTACGLNYSVYDQVVSNPDIDSVTAAVSALRESGAKVLVGVGGGSSLDTAKAVKIAASGPPDATIWEYAALFGEGKRPLPARNEMMPYIAIPTTAGTGAEVTPWAVITNPEKEIKFGVGDWASTPEAALVDPELTLGLPSHLTAATGMDALSHLIEAYVSTNHNPVLDPMILYGIELVGRSLRTAVVRGSDRAARRDMLEASLIGGIAISSKWLGACHSLAHPLSSLAGLHHGLACAIMLPHQMRYSLVGAVERYAAVAAALDPGCSTCGSLRGRADGAVSAVQQLMRDIDCPMCLRDVGVKRNLIPPLAKAAYIDLNWWTNPRQVDE